MSATTASSNVTPAVTKKVADEQPAIPEEKASIVVVAFWFLLFVIGVSISAQVQPVVDFIRQQILARPDVQGAVQTLVDRVLTSETGAWLFEGFTVYDTAKWATMNPWFVWGAVLAYISFVMFGKAFMQGREALKIRFMLRAYNLIILSVSVYMTYTIIAQHRLLGYKIFCNPVSNGDAAMTNVIWIFFISKCFEFLDTVWMVLRKNNDQITFLHVYHHASIFPFWWFILLGFPNGDAYFTALLNSGVHSIMYSYYALTSFGIRLPKPFKFFITLLQQTQFLTMLYQCYHGYVTDCSRPRIYMAALSVYLITMLTLFANYQVHEYCSKSNRRPAKDTGTDAKKTQ